MRQEPRSRWRVSARNSTIVSWRYHHSQRINPVRHQVLFQSSFPVSRWCKDDLDMRKSLMPPHMDGTSDQRQQTLARSEGSSIQPPAVARCLLRQGGEEGCCQGADTCGDHGDPCLLPLRVSGEAGGWGGIIIEEGFRDHWHALRRTPI